MEDETTLEKIVASLQGAKKDLLSWLKKVTAERDAILEEAVRENEKIKDNKIKILKKKIERM